jgi:hypothetical protein
MFFDYNISCPVGHFRSLKNIIPRIRINTARLRIFRGDSRHVETRTPSENPKGNFASLQGFGFTQFSRAEQYWHPYLSLCHGMWGQLGIVPRRSFRLIEKYYPLHSYLSLCHGMQYCSSRENSRNLKPWKDAIYRVSTF